MKKKKATPNKKKKIVHLKKPVVNLALLSQDTKKYPTLEETLSTFEQRLTKLKIELKKAINEKRYYSFVYTKEAISNQTKHIKALKSLLPKKKKKVIKRNANIERSNYYESHYGDK